MLNIISAIVGGLIIGALARFLYPAEVPMSWGMTALLGVGGSLVAGLAASARTGQGIMEGFNRAGCLASVLGAMILIYIGRHLGWH